MAGIDRHGKRARMDALESGSAVAAAATAAEIDDDAACCTRLLTFIVIISLYTYAVLFTAFVVHEDEVNEQHWRAIQRTHDAAASTSSTTARSQSPPLRALRAGAWQTSKLLPENWIEIASENLPFDAGTLLSTIERERLNIVARYSGSVSTVENAMLPVGNEQILGRQLLRPLLAQRSLTIAALGMSNTAGYGTSHNVSYPYVLGRKLSSIVYNNVNIVKQSDSNDKKRATRAERKRKNLNVRVRNRGAGGSCATQTLLCLPSQAGDEVDIVLWEYIASIVEMDMQTTAGDRDSDRYKEYVASREMYIRQAQLLTYAPPVHFVYPGLVTRWAEEACAGDDNERDDANLCVRPTPHTDDFRLDDIPHFLTEYNDPTDVVLRDYYALHSIHTHAMSVKRGTYYADHLPCCTRKSLMTEWHPSVKGHVYIADSLLYYYLHALRTSLLSFLMRRAAVLHRAESGGVVDAVKRFVDIEDNAARLARRADAEPPPPPPPPPQPQPPVANDIGSSRGIDAHDNSEYIFLVDTDWDESMMLRIEYADLDITSKEAAIARVLPAYEALNLAEASGEDEDWYSDLQCNSIRQLDREKGDGAQRSLHLHLQSACSHAPIADLPRPVGEFCSESLCSVRPYCGTSYIPRIKNRGLVDMAVGGKNRINCTDTHFLCIFAGDVWEEIDLGNLLEDTKQDCVTSDDAKWRREIRRGLKGHSDLGLSVVPSVQGGYLNLPLTLLGNYHTGWLDFDVELSDAKAARGLVYACEPTGMWGRAIELSRWSEDIEFRVDNGEPYRMRPPHEWALRIAGYWPKPLGQREDPGGHCYEIARDLSPGRHTIGVHHFVDNNRFVYISLIAAF